MQPIVDSLRWRCAIKQFDVSRSIPEADWQAIEEALLLSPSAYGLQPWRFLVVRDPQTRRALRVASQDQAQVEECSHLVVLAARTEIDACYLEEYLNRVAAVRDIPLANLAGYRQMVLDDIVSGQRGPSGEWAVRQTYLALGNLLTVAALGRIDACPLEGIVPGAYDEILGLAETPYRTKVACALGYRDEADEYPRRRKVRFPREALFSYV